jgi:hypothetical protein
MLVAGLVLMIVSLTMQSIAIGISGMLAMVIANYPFRKRKAADKRPRFDRGQNSPPRGQTMRLLPLQVSALCTFLCRRFPVVAAIFPRNPRDANW